MICLFRSHKFKRTHNNIIGCIISYHVKCEICHKKMMIWWLTDKGEEREKGIRISLL